MTMRAVLTRTRPTRGESPHKGRGYTIMEVTLVAFLSTILVVGIMRWLVGIGGVAGAQLSGAENSSLVRAIDSIAADLLGARGCLETGTDAPITEVSPTVLSLYTATGGGESVHYVVWTISGNTLTRNQTLIPSGQCNDQPPEPSPANDVTWSYDLDPQRSNFSLIRAGQTVPEGTQPQGGACTHPWEEQCAVDAVDVTLTREGDDQSSRRVLSVN